MRAFSRGNRESERVPRIGMNVRAAFHHKQEAERCEKKEVERQIKGVRELTDDGVGKASWCFHNPPVASFSEGSLDGYFEIAFLETQKKSPSGRPI